MVRQTEIEHAGIDRRRWAASLDDLDRRLAGAIREHVGPAPLATDDAAEIADGFRQLARLTRGASVDYDRRGVALAYVFKYLFHRVSHVAAGLALLQRHRSSPPTRVLDIGSGTDASLLALRSWRRAVCSDDGGSPARLVALEPSAAMRSVGEMLVAGNHAADDALVRVDGSLDFRRPGWRLRDKRIDALGRFDTVVMSSVIEYDMPVRDGYWSALARALFAPGEDACAVVVTAPETKTPMLERLRIAFERDASIQVHSYLYIGGSSGGNGYALGPIIEPHPVRHLDALIRSYAPQLLTRPELGEGRKMLTDMVHFGIDSWNSKRRDSVLIGIRTEAARPSLYRKALERLLGR